MTHFEKVLEHAIPTLQATLEEYVAPASGARHIHLRTDGADMAFLVAFPTIPDVSDGRAHILEHLALCGSQRYPVRDPFFGMMRRSTASFMNAMTYADRTAYPFASTDENDFANLLDVYLDATFFPKLDYLSFLQEGWRYTLTDGKLGYQGVVFNEMKGAYGDPMQALYRGATAPLLAGTTYAFDSGGDPLVIPSLTHATLLDFHATHYSPSQAVFMTAGPMDAASVQRQIGSRVLDRHHGRTERRLPQLAAIPAQTLRHTITVPSHEPRDDEFGLQITWLLGESAQPHVAADAWLLTAGLFGDASAPLRQAMESAGFGRPSALNGHDDSPRQMLFHLGMDGLTSAQVDQAEALILTTLANTAEHGVPLATLQAALRDMTFSERDTRAGQMPNVLHRLLRALPVAMRASDVVGAFDTAAVLATLERDIEDPDYFKALVRTLLDAPGRQVTRVEPDTEYFARRDEVEYARLRALEGNLNETDRARIDADAVALAAHQRHSVSSAVLPRITPADVGRSLRPTVTLDAVATGVQGVSIASNGISSASVVHELTALPEADWPWLGLYAEVVTELGVDALDYAATDAWRQRLVPQFQVELQALQSPTGALLLDLAFSASALREEHANLVEVIVTSLTAPRFDEHARLAYLIETKVAALRDNLAQDGDRYAMLAGTAPYSAARRFQEAVGGVGALAFYGKLAGRLATDGGVQHVGAQLTRIHAVVRASPRVILCGGSGADGQILAAMLEQALPAADQAAGASLRPATASGLPTPLHANVALHAPAQVNHCGIAWNVPALQGRDAPALAVAAELLSQQVLHAMLREAGGAYGGNATYDRELGLFSMRSYRDPRLAATYADFGTALTQLLATEYAREQVEEAIIGVIKQLDKPDSPWESLRTAWRRHRCGIDTGDRQRFRDGVLDCDQAAVNDAVRRWLVDGVASRAAFAGAADQPMAGLQLVVLAVD